MMSQTLREILREMIVPRLHPLFVHQAPKSFRFRNIRYKYVRHLHNRTWVNERIVEVALGLSLLKKHQGTRILEVGNVLSNYSSVSHDILDKYELSEGIINEDIVHFNPRKRYDIIICISTLEHVGWDEIPKEPEKIHVAVRQMKRLLSPKGMMMITTPFGYNSYLDTQILHSKLPFDEVYFMKRKSWRNDWVEVAQPNPSRTHYSWFFMHANTIAISYIYGS